MRSLIIFFVLAYLISWLLWFPLYSSALGLNGLPVLPFHHGIGGLGPMIASLVCTRLFEGKEGFKILIRQMFKLKPFLYVTIALFTPFLLVVIAAILNNLLNHHPVQLTRLFVAKEFPQFSFISFLLYNLVFFGFGEEVGWRGFALPRLQAKYNALWASVLLTLFWALWHWPLFLYRPGFMGMGIGGAFGWLVSLLTGSVLLTWLYNSSKSSLLVCAIFHSTIDIAFLADFDDQNIINYTGMLITMWGIATILIFKPKNLATTEKVIQKK